TPLAPNPLCHRREGCVREGNRSGGVEACMKRRGLREKETHGRRGDGIDEERIEE
ncbi:Hypothetical predicted protein, partial [Olea europaea subsp. europaea]